MSKSLFRQAPAGKINTVLRDSFESALLGTKVHSKLSGKVFRSLQSSAGFTSWFEKPQLTNTGMNFQCSVPTPEEISFLKRVRKAQIKEA